jgi:hypothetical protein
MGFPVRVLEGLIPRREEGSWTNTSSLPSSPASAMSTAENGFSRVAALGFRMFRSLAWPTKGDVCFGRGALLAAPGFIGVAGASCGIGAADFVVEEATGCRFPMLRMAGSANGCVAGAGLVAAGAA